MPRTGENIYKRKDGRWEARYIKYYGENGKAKYGYLYAKTYKEVKLKLSQVSNLENSDLKESIQFEHILEQWLENKRTKLKESSYAHYDHLTSKYLREAFGNYPINKITTPSINQVLNQLLITLSPKTVSDIGVILKSILRYAQDEGYNLNCNLHAFKVKLNKKEVKILTKQEKSILSKYLFSNPSSLNLGILLSLYTGIRIGELCALKWKDIYLEENVLSIRNTLQRIKNYHSELNCKTVVILTTPKSYCSIRDIPIPEFLLPLLLQLNSCPENYLLTNNPSHLEPRSLQNKFKRCLKEIGLPEKNFHILRHTFATSCIEVGFEIKSLSEILGHSNVSITLNKYVHSSIELKKSNMQKLTFF